MKKKAKELENRIIAIASEYAADGCILPLKVAIEGLFEKPTYKIKICSACKRRCMGEKGLSAHWGRSHSLADLQPMKRRLIDKNNPLAILVKDVKAL